MGATLETQLLKMVFELFETIAGDIDVASVVKVIESDSTELGEIQSTYLGSISSFCIVKDWKC